MSAIRANPLFIFAILSLLVVLSEWLARRDGLRHLGAALLVIIVAAVAANAGVIPAGSTPEAPVPVYDAIFAYVAPIAIFWLLLSVNLQHVLRAGIPIIALFLVGSVGTMLGVIVGMRLVGGATTIGPSYQALAGMFAGTYIGGSVNFNAIALHYGVVRDGPLYGGAIVVDNILTTLWMVVTIALPRTVGAWWAARRPAAPSAAGPAGPIVELETERETVTPRGVAAMLALGAGALWLSESLAQAVGRAGVTLPAILVITTLALVLAQVPAVHRLPGSRALGMYAVYLFLAVIGAFCDVRALGRIGEVGLVLLAFATATVLVHGILTFGTAWLLRMDLATAAVASQANIGGSTSALALAKSLGREDLLVPGILIGALGNAIGTFLGFAVVTLA